MNSTLILTVLILYFLLLILISRWTSKGADSETFFTANRSSPWYLVAFGMIGASLSGVTMISIPGKVGFSSFAYMQMVFGYLLGYFVISQVLIPLYYRKNLRSIYTYLHERFGLNSYRTGSAFFLVSRIIGASFRLYLVAFVLDAFVLAPMGVPFALTVAITIVLIWLYSFKAGIKTIVWTDTLQTTFMLASVVFTMIYIGSEMDLGVLEMGHKIASSEFSKIWVTDVDSSAFFVKHILAGMFITIAMTGLDQDMMQKNLTCKSEKEAKKNITWMSLSLVPVNLIFLSLGALLYIYGADQGIISFNADAEIPLQILNPETNLFEAVKPDKVFPYLAINHMPIAVGLVFIIGLIAAAYSSADSALTALTTSFCVDFLGFKKGEERKKERYIVHLGFSFIIFLVIVGFKPFHDDAIIDTLFGIAGYTYGPILGLFTYGLIAKRQVKDKMVPLGLVLVTIITYGLNWIITEYSEFRLGFTVLLVNGILTMLYLHLISYREKKLL